jgi:hypothetical protein
MSVCLGNRDAEYNVRHGLRVQWAEGAKFYGSPLSQAYARILHREDLGATPKLTKIATLVARQPQRRVGASVR